MEATNLADLYQLPLLDWASIEDKLRSGVEQAPGGGGPNRHTCWLSTINADGSPHVNGVGALWADGCFWFETGQGSRKGRNLARDPRCAMSLATEEFDLVVEGEASLPRGTGVRAALDAACAAAGFTPRIVFEASALPMVVELAGRGLGLAVVPASMPNGPGILRITDPQLRSRLELAWPSAPSANPAARALIEQARALGPPGRSAP